MASPDDATLALLKRWYRHLDPQRALDLTRKGGEDQGLYVALDSWAFEGKAHELRGRPAAAGILRNIRIASGGDDAQSR